MVEGFEELLCREGKESGVLASQHLRAAIESGVIAAAAAVPPGNIQPASIDLRIGRTAHRLQCSFLADRETVASRVERYSMGEVDLTKGAVLERDRPYLVRLEESLHLPGMIRAKANPKSSTGRLDVFTRLVTDRSHVFDEVATGYRGPLYLEIVPRTFTVRIQAGQSLNQLRLMLGNPILTDDALRRLHTHTPLLFRDGRSVPYEEAAMNGGLLVGIDVGHGRDAVIGYRARANSWLIDVGRRNHYDIAAYWEPVHPDGAGFIVLNPEEFYLLMSRDEVRVPPAYAAEMTAYDPTSGELRAHYAGFFDPGFGWHHDGDSAMGTKAALEVRAHDVPFAVEQGQRMCRLSYEEMLSVPTRYYSESSGSSYSAQTKAVGKQFRGPGE